MVLGRKFRSGLDQNPQLILHYAPPPGQNIARLMARDEYARSTMKEGRSFNDSITL